MLDFIIGSLIIGGLAAMIAGDKEDSKNETKSSNRITNFKVSFNGTYNGIENRIYDKSDFRYSCDDGDKHYDNDLCKNNSKIIMERSVSNNIATYTFSFYDASDSIEFKLKSNNVTSTAASNFLVTPANGIKTNREERVYGRIDFKYSYKDAYSGVRYTGNVNNNSSIKMNRSVSDKYVYYEFSHNGDTCRIRYDRNDISHTPATTRSSNSYSLDPIHSDYKSTSTTNNYKAKNNNSYLESTLTTYVVGVTHDGRPEIIRNCINDGSLKVGTHLTLVGEPNNIYDKYAVAVYVGCHKIGYLRKNLITSLREDGLYYNNAAYCRVDNIKYDHNYNNEQSYGIEVSIKFIRNTVGPFNDISPKNISNKSVPTNCVTIEWETSLNNGIINSSGISVRPVPYLLVENRKEWYNSSAVCPYDRDMELYKLRARGTYTIFEGQKTYLFNLFTCPICRRFYASVATSNDPLNTSLPLTQYALVSKQYKKEEYDHMITTAMNTWNCNE